MHEHEEFVKRIFESAKIDLDDNLKAFLGATGVSVEYFAWANTTASVFSAKLIEKGLTMHAAALVQSAKASEKHARSLAVATWLLFLATLALACTSYLLGKSSHAW